MKILTLLNRTKSIFLPFSYSEKVPHFLSVDHVYSYHTWVDRLPRSSSNTTTFAPQVSVVSTKSLIPTRIVPYCRYNPRGKQTSPDLRQAHRPVLRSFSAYFHSTLLSSSRTTHSLIILQPRATLLYL